MGNYVERFVDCKGERFVGRTSTEETFGSLRQGFISRVVNVCANQVRINLMMKSCMQIEDNILRLV